MSDLKVLNLLRSGGVGGIEVLCKNISKEASFDNTFCFLFSEGLIYKEMLQDGVDVISYAEYSQLSLKRLFALYKLSKTYNVIVLHHNDIFMQLYFILLKRLNPMPVYIMVIHSCFDKKYYFYKSYIKTLLRNYVLKQAFKQSECNIFVSKAGLGSFHDYVLYNNNNYIVYNGIEEEKLKTGLTNVLQIGNFFEILYIGRLTEAKGVDRLIEAVVSLEVQYNVRLTIVGDGEERELLEQMASKLEANIKVNFEGFQLNIEKYLQVANVFIYPSVCQEIFGISVVEAMSYGLPCIVNEVGGLVEIIEDGTNGYFTENDTALGIKNAIYRAIHDYEEGKIDLISAAAKLTAAKFSVKNTTHELYAIYQSMVKR